MENLPVKLLVLYGEQGRIVSLRRLRSADQPGAAPTMRSGVDPGKGQRLAEITVDATYDGWSLKDIHEQFSVGEEHGRPRLIHRPKAAAAE